MADPGQLLNTFIAHYGILALFLLLALEEVGVWLPLPGDLLIVYFGYRIARTPQPLLGAVPVILTVVAAALCGSTILYLVVRRNRRLLRRLAPLIHLDETWLQRMEPWLQRRGAAVIILVRLVPGLRIPTTIVAATFGVRLETFVPSIATSAALWGVVYFLVGAAGQTAIEAARHALHREVSGFLLPALVAASALAALLRFWHPWHRIRSEST
jgi:membrane-associated protein